MKIRFFQEEENLCIALTTDSDFEKSFLKWAVEDGMKPGTEGGFMRFEYEEGGGELDFYLNEMKDFK